MPYLAAIEVDRRQQIIGATDKLKEMLGASWHIGATVPKALDTLRSAPATEMVMPVSGAIWITSTNLEELTRVLVEVRLKVVEELDLRATFAIVEYADFNEARTRLNAQVRALKDAKTGEDSAPTPALAANCRILPTLAANKWVPRRDRTEQHKRRALVSETAELRLRRGNLTLKNFERQLFPLNKGWRTPWQLDHFTQEIPDQYIALVTADADGMNRIMADRDWIVLGKTLGVSAEKAMHRFSIALDDCIWRAVHRAAETALQNEGAPRNRFFPIIPFIRAGEDTAVVCRRDLALPFAISLGRNFEEAARRDPLLGQFSGPDALSLSFGVVYTKRGYPFQMTWELAGDLLSSAKRARAERNATGGFVDLQWFASSGRTDIGEIRRQSLMYQAGMARYRLTTRPWNLGMAGRMYDAARTLSTLVVSSRWVELETALWAGGPLTDLGWRRWLLQLKRAVREQILSYMVQWAPADDRYPRQSPWFRATVDGTEYECCGLLDIAELIRTMQGEGSDLG